MTDYNSTRDLVARNIDKPEITELERKMMRYRWLDIPSHTLEETGRKFGGITKERVRQIESKTLEMIRQLIK